MLFDYLESIFLRSLEQSGYSSAGLIFETPRDPSHGDAATPVAMGIAKSLKQNPRKIAEEILERLVYDPLLLKSVSIAGAGFINISFSQRYYDDLLSRILQAGERIGRSSDAAGKRANVEFVSANPTGPLHPGHARNIMLGDTIAELLSYTGYQVTREYYFNDAGNQMRNLALSVYARYRQASEPDYPFPEDGYKGDYIRGIAEGLLASHGQSLKEGAEEDLATCRQIAQEFCFKSIKNTLKRLGVDHDTFFNERTLYTEGHIERVLAFFETNSLSYERDGAIWIKTSELGLENDRVIVKSTGEPTYRLPDMAYHKIKLERGDDLVVDIFGTDHMETVKEVVAGARALGCDTGKLKVVLHQMVSFLKDGKPYKLSKRNGEQYTLDDLIDELGADVVRFFFLMRAASTQLLFDMDLARDQSENNPVFYLQYAHARICSVFRSAEEKAVTVSDNVDLSLLQHARELELIKLLARYPDTVKKAAASLEPHVICDYLREVGAAFHAFYHDCRILGVEEGLVQARLKLARASQNVFKSGLELLGLQAPEKM